MSTEFALDLRAARRKAGYTQGDIAHLINHHQSYVSALETGRERPDLEQIVLLSLIYGRSFESYFDAIMSKCRTHLNTRLASLPPSGTRTAGTYNRDNSLKKLNQRLAAETSNHDGA